VQHFQWLLKLQVTRNARSPCLITTKLALKRGPGQSCGGLKALSVREHKSLGALNLTFCWPGSQAAIGPCILKPLKGHIEYVPLLSMNYSL
jgi:hypothetical protein